MSFGFICGNFVTSLFSVRVGINRMIVIGSCFAVVGLVIAWSFISRGMLTPLTLFLPVMLALFGNGMAMPNTQAGAINVNPGLAGSASGLSGFLQMSVAGLASQSVALIHDGTAFPMIYMMMAGALAAIVAITVGFVFGGEASRP